MAGFTNNYYLAYFDFGDVLNAPINVQREIDRFLLIDKQIYGLYTIFDNGVITGWEANNSDLSQDPNGISVSISSGRGVINRKLAETKVPYVLGPLPINTTLYVYAQLIKPEFTSVSNTIFTFSEDSAITNAVKIAKIITDGSTVTTIDNTDKDYVFVEGQIDSAIATHVHRGSPSKIDLGLHTKNRLFGAKVESLDASKITSGRFDLERISVLNHNDLIYKGVLTHAQLDTYVQNFSETNQIILGNIATTNRILQTLRLKLIYSNIDEYFINELDYIAGISPASYYDELNTTATVDVDANTIAGFPFASTTAYFFTKNFSLPSTVTKCFVAAQQDVVSDGSITFGINLANSVDWDDYTQLTSNTVNVLDLSGTDMRVAIRLISPSNLFSHDPYETSFINYIDFDFLNESASTQDFHFRIRFYNDAAMTGLYLTKFSETDQDGWIINDTFTIPAAGQPVASGDNIQVTYYPDASEFGAGIMYYMIIDIWDGSSFTVGAEGYTFVSSGEDSDDKYANIPRVDGFSTIIELENNQTLRLNS